MYEIWRYISWMWRGLWSSTRRYKGLEIRIWSSNILDGGKIGYLDPSSLQGVTSWLPPMSRSLKKSTFVMMLLPFFINLSRILLIPHFTPLIDFQFRDKKFLILCFREICSNTEICFTSLVSHCVQHFDIVNKIFEENKCLVKFIRKELMWMSKK